MLFWAKKWLFLGKKSGFLVMVAPEPLIICSKTLQNALFSVQHPQNRVWGPTCDHSGPRNTVLGQILASFEGIKGAGLKENGFCKVLEQVIEFLGAAITKKPHFWPKKSQKKAFFGLKQCVWGPSGQL